RGSLPYGQDSRHRAAPGATDPSWRPDQPDRRRGRERKPVASGMVGVHAVGMGVLDMIANRVADGSTVEFRPTGASMVPLIRSRQLVTVAPVNPRAVEVGDIVLARVAGTTYLHLVSAVDAVTGRVQISNHPGRVNGWTA